MMATYKIDNELFINLSRVLSLVNEQISRESRAGLAARFWKTGKRGRQFSVVSVTNCTDTGFAITKLKAYQALIGKVVNVTWAGQDFGGQDVIILDVNPLEQGVQGILLGVGGVTGLTHQANGISEAVLRCRWDLEAV